MKRLLLFVLIIMGFCGRFASDAKRCPVAQVVVEPVEPLLVRPVQDDMQCRLWVDSVLDRLSLKERVGQLFIYTIAPHQDKSNRELLRKVIEDYKVGGLLFSGGLMQNQVVLTNEAQRMADIPLLITFDGEWGLSMRLRDTPAFPKNMVLGCIQNDSLLYEYGREMARQCKELGVQVNFAPVADVNINPKNPVINTRSFGEDPVNVANKVIAYARGLEDGGVLSVAKHFPGHGDTDVDSHKALPVLTFTRERLDSVELYPFKKVIEEGLGGIMAGIMKSISRKTTNTIGNFWNFLVLSCTRILLPLSLIVGFILITQGTPMGFDGKMEVTTLEGQEQMVSQGPVAAIVPIKQLGTNGGGYFGVNSSHPLENPTYLSNIVECWSILIIPMAMVFALGFYTKRMKLAYSIYGVMLCAYLAGVGINVYQEMNGNPRIDDMGIAQDNGAMEGKEIRLGAGATALWSITTTVTSNGSVNGMHDSTMPLSGMMEMLNMQINTWFGGVGVGWMNYYTFIIIAVFISGLMVGRTPEFLGKKVEAREMKIATIVALLHPFVILVGTALSCYLFAHHPEFVESEGGWLNNPGFHGLSEQFYEFTSCAANNGSGFEGLGDNTYFWNYACGWVLILSRFLPIVGQVAIAGLLAQKRFVPESAGTLKTDTFTFAVMTFAVIFIVAALSFFPAHALSTIAEHFSL